MNFIEPALLIIAVFVFIALLTAWAVDLDIQKLPSGEGWVLFYYFYEDGYLNRKCIIIKKPKRNQP